MRRKLPEDKSWGEMLSNWKHLIEESIINEERMTASSTEVFEEDTEEKSKLCWNIWNGEQNWMGTRLEMPL